MGIDTLGTWIRLAIFVSWADGLRELYGSLAAGHWDKGLCKLFGP